MYYLQVVFADGSRSEALCSVAVADDGHLIATPLESHAQPRIFDSGAVIDLQLIQRGVPKKEAG